MFAQYKNTYLARGAPPGLIFSPYKEPPRKALTGWMTARGFGAVCDVSVPADRASFERAQQLLDEEIYLCIDCGAETEPLDIPLCPKCAKKYDLKRFWEDHDRQGYPEPWNFMENYMVRKEYTIAVDRRAK